MRCRYQALAGHNAPAPGSPHPGSGTATPNKTDADAASHYGGGVATGPGQVELVTVPALGPEWRKEEMRGMTKAAKREKKYESRREAWRAWNRGERGICGGWFTRKMLVITMFVVCIM